MTSRVIFRLAAPAVILGVVLLTLGAVAAYSVQHQQKTSSDLIAREVRALVVMNELRLDVREIRYQLNMFLRTGDLQNLSKAAQLQNSTRMLVTTASELARTDRERELIEVVSGGYLEFEDELQTLTAELPGSWRFSVPEAWPGTESVPGTESAGGLSAAVRLLPLATPAPGDAGTEADRVVHPRTLPPETRIAVTRMCDDILTNRVLQPLQECIVFDQNFVTKANETGAETTRLLRVGFLLLGVCGGGAGMLLGTVMARTVSRSIVQFNVSVRSAMDRLSHVTDPVEFSTAARLSDIEQCRIELEQNISQVVERLQQQELDVLRNEQLAQVGQLAAGLAHELRNPLMPMKMIVQAAIERGEPAALSGRSLRILNDEISRLEKSIQLFLDFARPPVPDKSLVNVTAILLSAVDLVAARAQAAHTDIHVEVPSESLHAIVDSIQLRQLVLNLLLNALDVLPEGGTITLKLREEQLQGTESPGSAHSGGNPEALSEHDAMRMPSRNLPARMMAIVVSDNGPGVPTELLSRIFEPFVTTHESGTGLGLSICRRIAAAHNGTISVANLSTGGAEFTVRIPLISSPSPAPLPSPQSPAEPRSSRINEAETARHR